MEYQLVFATNSNPDPIGKLGIAIGIITKASEESSKFSYINHGLLTKIIINEFSKSYLTKEVDLENKEGYFVIYKRLVNRLATMIQAVDVDYKFPLSLASTILEGALHQYFLMDHFSSLTNCNRHSSPAAYFKDMVSRTLNLPSNG